METIPRREFILSEGQQRVVEAVRRVGRRFSLEVEVVDVARENVLRRVVQEERGKIRTFPTLVADTGRRFEGEMTEEKVESFLCQIAGEGLKKYLQGNTPVRT